MIERNNFVPSLLAGAEKFFITEIGESDRLLGKVWEIINELCPIDSSSEISLEVPSQTLVNLGLVSEIAEGEIIGRVNRKKQKDQSDEPKNKVAFKKMGPDEFLIRKTYVSEETTEFSFLREEIESPFRIDRIMTEEIVLSKNNENFNFKMRIKSDSEHLHANGQRWIPAVSRQADNQWQEVTPSTRDLNRTLALIVEGLFPGYLSAQKLA